MSKAYSTGNNIAVIATKSIIKFSTVITLLFGNYNTITAQVSWNDAGAATEWYRTANWNPAKSAGSWLPTDIAQFNNTGTATTAGIDMSQGALSIGALLMDRERNLTIGNSSATPGVLQLNGAMVAGIPNTIVYSATTIPGTGFSIQHNETGTGKTMELALGNTTENVINITSYNTLEISTPVTGANKQLKLISPSGEAATVILSGANTYTGSTLCNVHHGSVIFNHPGGGTLPSTNDVIVNEGGLYIKSDQTLHDMTVIGYGFLYVTDGVTLTITGMLSKGPATCGIVVQGTGKIVYTPGATLRYINGLSFLNTGAAEFPSVSGPTNLVLESYSHINLHQSRTIAGTFSLIGSGGLLMLGANNLTAGNINANGGGGVKTNGTGFLKVSNVGTTAVTFPVTAGGYGTRNSVTIANGGGMEYGVRVVNGIDGALNFPDANTAINKTWIIERPSTPVSPVDISFAYSNTEGNAGFNYNNPLKLSQYNGIGWTAIQNNIPQLQPVPTSTTTALTPVTGSMFVLSNTPLGGPLASPVKIDLTVQQQNSRGHLTWTIDDISEVKNISIERAADARSFTALQTVSATTVNYDDVALLPATNYYRLKLTSFNSKITYSPIVVLLNKESGFDIISIAPTIVNTSTTLNVVAAQKAKMKLVITDASGKKVQQLDYNLQPGSSQVLLNLSSLATGVYMITGYNEEGISKTLRFVKQ